MLDFPLYSFKYYWMRIVTTINMLGENVIMEQKMFKEELAKRAEQFSVKLSEKQQNQFYEYMRAIIRME